MAALYCGPRVAEKRLRSCACIGRKSENLGVSTSQSLGARPYSDRPPARPPTAYQHRSIRPTFRLFPSLDTLNRLLLPQESGCETPPSPGTMPGVFRDVVVPSPNCPKAFPPQLRTVPSAFNARLCAWSTGCRPRI